ncbi:YjiH family protein [Salicibibacter halophilus]|uniref:YjiH family protein n=1 Tax=Salicibibacter halophilus TaxID=2502791 RepID=UPI0029C64C7F|nr:nucleoside recognition domain-containing protein [Salicibibacter halophilus]
MSNKKRLKGQHSLDRNDKKNYFKFIFPSLLAAGLFMIPISYEGQWTIAVGVLVEILLDQFEAVIPWVMSWLLVICALFALIVRVAQPLWVMNHPFLYELFFVNNFWLVLRILGAVFAFLTLYQVGPSLIIHESTGQVVLYDLVVVLAAWFLFAGLLIPILMDYGLMEYLGTLVRKIMRPVFKVPGRSSVDAAASWMGSSVVGVLISMKQHEQGFYSEKEAATVVTNFTIASPAFGLIVVNIIGLDHMFLPMYITVTIAVIIAAIICPRIPPLSRKSNTYKKGVGQQIGEEVPTDKSNHSWAVEKAVGKASYAEGPVTLLKKGIQNILDVWIGVLPLIMAVGTVAMIIAEFTPVFTYLSYPLIPILELMGSLRQQKQLRR